MTGAFRIGPLVFPSELLVLIAAGAVGLIAARLLGRQEGDAARLGTVLWRALIIGLVAARLSFVWRYRDSYLPDPIKILDLRDGGWNGLFGLAAVWLYAMVALLRRHAPRAALLGALLLASATWLGFGRWVTPSERPVPELASLSVHDMNGTATELSDFRGKPVVINLWASWCPPCRREMPAFAGAQAANPDIHFVFLNQGEAKTTVSQFLKEHAPDLHNVLIDPASEASRQFSNRGLPATLFLDADGQLIDLRVGELSSATLEQRLEAIRSPSQAEAEAAHGAE